MKPTRRGGKAKAGATGRRDAGNATPKGRAVRGKTSRAAKPNPSRNPERRVRPPPPDDLIDLSLATARVRPREGYAYIIHPLADGVPRCDPKLLQAWVEWAETHKDCLATATLIAAPEAMGLPFAAALSLKTGIPYVIARKRQYALEGEMIAYCETGYGRSCLYLNDVGPEDRVLWVDDVLSTGSTMEALLSATKESGALPVGVLVFLDKGKAAARLAKRHSVPVRAMRRVSVAAGRLRLLAGARGKAH